MPQIVVVPKILQRVFAATVHKVDDVFLAKVFVQGRTYDDVQLRVFRLSNYDSWYREQLKLHEPPPVAQIMVDGKMVDEPNPEPRDPMRPIPSEQEMAEAGFPCYYECEVVHN
jgi:hypothetical protein